MMTLAEHNQIVKEREEALRNINLAGVKCDHCGATMVFEQKTSPIGTGQHVRCPKCSYRGFKRD